ncbi:MAG: Wzz/FepE/Etk N-terminal domain-containing protein [Eubacteriales bacterium]|nr:Wzz/FepE/Etk N-terminal domain-containing protein [Eubacteriales bacterium]
MEEKNDLTFSDLIGIVKKFWFIILISCLLFGGLAFILTKKQTEKYSSSATFYIMAKKDLNLSLDKDITLTNAVTPWISNYITSTLVVDELNHKYLVKINEKYSGISTESLQESIRSSISDYKDIDYNKQFKLTVTTSSPELCRDIIQAYIDMFRDPELAIADISEYDIKCADQPALGNKVSPSMTRNLAIGIIVGAILTYVILFIRFITNNVISTSEDLSKRFSNIPVLAVIPEINPIEKDTDNGKSSTQKKSSAKKKTEVNR